MLYMSMPYRQVSVEHGRSDEPHRACRGGTRPARRAPAGCCSPCSASSCCRPAALAWTSAVIDVLGRLGVEEKATRQALMRTAARRLAGGRAGRPADPVAAHPGRRAAAHRGHRADLRLRRGAARLGRALAAGAGPRAGDATGRARHHLRTRLTWAGSRQRRARGVDQPARASGSPRSSRCWPGPAWPGRQVFVAEHAGRGDLAAMVRQAWDLAGIEAGYQEFLAEFAVAGRRPAGPAGRAGARLAAVPRDRPGAADGAAAAAAGAGSARPHCSAAATPPGRRPRPPTGPAWPPDRPEPQASLRRTRGGPAAGDCRGGRRSRGRKGRSGARGAVGRGSGPSGAGALRAATGWAEARGMKVRLAYGRSGLETDFPDDAVVVAPEHRDAAADQMAALRRALREPVAGPPLREQVRPGQTVAISACDGTRPQPRHLMIPARARRAGRDRPARGRHRAGRDRHPPRQHPRRAGRDVRRADRRPGPHRQPRRPGRLDAAVGRHVRRRRAGLAQPGVVCGRRQDHDGLRRAALLRRLLAAARRWSRPAWPAWTPCSTLHDARRIGHPDARWGITEGNPVHDDVRAIAAGTGVDFALDVVLNRDQDIVAGLRRRAVRHAQGGDRDRAGGGDAPGRPLLRRGRHDELRLPARPEPLPGGQGHERGRPGRRGPAA